MRGCVRTCLAQVSLQAVGSVWQAMEHIRTPMDARSPATSSPAKQPATQPSRQGRCQASRRQAGGQAVSKLQAGDSAIKQPTSQPSRPLTRLSACPPSYRLPGGGPGTRVCLRLRLCLCFCLGLGRHSRWRRCVCLCLCPRLRLRLCLCLRTRDCCYDRDRDRFSPRDCHSDCDRVCACSYG